MSMSDGFGHVPILQLSNGCCYVLSDSHIREKDTGAKTRSTMFMNPFQRVKDSGSRGSCLEGVELLTYMG